jgi:hypothetical protein
MLDPAKVEVLDVRAPVTGPTVFVADLEHQAGNLPIRSGLVNRPPSLLTTSMRTSGRKVNRGYSGRSECRCLAIAGT